MYKQVGYVWPGMLRVSTEEARKLFNEGAAVYCLHTDNTEGAVSELDEIADCDDYGVEMKEFSFEEYLSSNQYDGKVYFSHGTDEVDDLLTLMKEFMECIRPSLRESLQDALDTVVRRIDKYLGTTQTDKKEAVWRCCVVFINGVLPMGWKFGAYENEGIDYVFVKEERVTA